MDGKGPVTRKSRKIRGKAFRTQKLAQWSMKSVWSRAQLPCSCFGFLVLPMNEKELMEFDQWTIGLEQGLSMPPFWFFSGSCCDSSQPHVPFFSDLPGWRKTIVDLERREKRPVLKPMWNLAICTLSRPSSPGSRFMVTTMDVQAEFHYCVGSLVFHPKFL